MSDQGRGVAMSRPRLLSPLQVGPMALRNRVVFCAHLTNLGEGGRPSARLARYYEARAAGGTGLVVTEELTVSPDDRPWAGALRGWDPAVVDGLAAVAAAVHPHGTKVVAQLGHAGPQSSGRHTRRPVLGPSAVPDAHFREVPVEAGPADLAAVTAAFAAAAGRCAAAGLDGVEIQCAQSSLLRAFLSPATNRRADRWGGDLAGRARLLLDVVAAVRAEIGPGLAVGVRLCTDERLGPDGTTPPGLGPDGTTPPGLGPDDAVAVARLLENHGGTDYVSTSVGLATTSMHAVAPSMLAPPGDDLAAAAAVRAAVGLRVVGTGRIASADAAEEALASGRCDLVGMVRALVADPDLVSKVAAGRGHAVRRCIGCNQGCVGRPGAGAPTACTVNPRAGREHIPLRAARSPRDVVVVGAGPAGLAAAVAAAGAGHRVTVTERAAHAGGRLRVAACGPGRARLAEIVEDLAREAVDLGVDLRLGVEATVASLVAGPAAAVVVATGAAATVPAWADGDPTVVGVEDLLGGRVAPAGRVVVVDGTGTHRAVSAAVLAAEAGAEVTVVTDALVVGGALGSTLDREHWWAAAARLGIREEPNLVVEGTGPDGVTATCHQTGRPVHLGADLVVADLGDRPCDELWRALRAAAAAAGRLEVHRVGDCVAPRDALAAVAEGHRVGAAL